jgi:uncharacterized membrane protein YphA (DoxX/SURF4 family)
MRIVAAAALAATASTGVSTPLANGSAAILLLHIGAGLLLLVGLWTPVAGLLVAMLEGWMLVSWPHDHWTHILLATLGGALALLGPGAWSIDARLFGWKRINIRDRQSRADRSALPEP